MLFRRITLFFYLSLVLLQGCGDFYYNPFERDTFRSLVVPKDITSFVLEAARNPVLSFDAIGVLGTDTVDITVPFGTTSLASLTPTIEITGTSIYPESNTPQAFTDGIAVTYTVTGNDGATKDYGVTVRVATSDAKDILSFAFTKALNPLLPADIFGDITGTIVDVVVPPGTDTSGLVPTIGISGVSVSPASGVAHSFSDGIGETYTVTAADSSIKDYTVTVYFPPAQVMVTNVTEDNGQVTVQWTDPPDADFDHVEIYWTPNGTGSHSVNAGVQTFTANGLTNGTEYTLYIVSVDTALAASAPVIVRVTPNAGGPIVNYCIYSADDLNAVRGGITAGWDKTKSYIVMADIDLAGYSPWTPIGTSGDLFTGNFNGNVHSISGLYINTTANYQGLFGYISGVSIVKNLTISNCNITGGQYLGALAGKFDQDGTGKAAITNCHVSGTITTNSTASLIYEGGLVGWIGTTTYTTKSTIADCSANVTVGSSGSASIYAYLGGITGRQEGSWSIYRCFVTGTMASAKGIFVGGIAGSSNGYIYDSYSMASVSALQVAGGLLGSSTGYTFSSYSTGDVTRVSGANVLFGGLVGDPNDPSRFAGFYSGTLSAGLVDNAAGTRKTLAEMQVQATFSGWDFTTIWDINPGINDGYPYLRSNEP